MKFDNLLKTTLFSSYSFMIITQKKIMYNVQDEYTDSYTAFRQNL